MIVHRNEMDRPTNNTLQYLTTVQPHFIEREPFLIDNFVHDTLLTYIGENAVDEFVGMTRSYYTLEGHYHNLWKYDRQILRKPRDPRLEMAIYKAASAFKLPNPVRSISWNSLARVPFIPSSSAGWGFKGKKGDPGNHAAAISKAVLSLKWWSEDQSNPNPTFRYHPDLAWTRTSLGTVEDPKIRNVWGKSFDNIILEGITASPLIDAYRTHSSPMPLGVNFFRKLPSIINNALFDGFNQYYGVGIDLSSFDSSVQPWLIEESFKILEDNIIFSDEEGYLSFLYSKHHFIHTPVVMPDGRLWLKHLGVPSGSYFTQLIDSIANYIATTYVQLTHYGQSFKTSVLGDDSLFGVPIEFGEPNLNDFVPHYSKLGFTMHPKKSLVADNPSQLEYLGHCARGAKVDRETAGMMRLALFPEHPVAGPAHSLNRIKGILLDSALNSWPIIHLHDLMMNRWRNELHGQGDKFITTEKDWLVTVLDISTPPSHINTVKTFTLT